MSLITEDISDDTPCVHCGHDFADHHYVVDSLDSYKCPVPTTEPVYGFFNGGDPRKFHPDGECCSQEEVERHREACKLWDEATARGETPTPEKCPSGWVFDEAGRAVAHVLRAPYGIGMYVYEYESFFEPPERDIDPDQLDLEFGEED